MACIMWVHVTLNDVRMPHHLGLIDSQPFDLMVSKSPRSPQIHDLHYFGVSDFTTPHIAIPPKSQVSGLSDLAPHVLYLSMTKIHFVVHDFRSFHTLKTLGQVPPGVPSLQTLGSGPTCPLPKFTTRIYSRL
jgi:hypothetical protein